MVQPAELNRAPVAVVHGRKMIDETESELLQNEVNKPGPIL
jgi:hypothetical protein